MSIGLAALLDDVAALAKVTAASADDIGSAAAKASSKTIAVVIDDTAVTPGYVTGISPNRELPIIRKIARGSIINKLFIIIPVALLLSTFAPVLLPYLLLIGGLYLSFEGAEKVLESLHIIKHHDEDTSNNNSEDSITSGAIRTDLILSTEIMLIALASIDTGTVWWKQLLILLIVAVVMTIVVYGAVAILIRVDDFGLKLSTNSNKQLVRKLGLSLVNVMPKIFTIITIIGTAAMLWVGGHLIITSLHDTFFKSIGDLLHYLEKLSSNIIIQWLIGTGFSALVALVIGSLITGLVFLFGNMIKSK